MASALDRLATLRASRPGRDRFPKHERSHAIARSVRSAQGRKITKQNDSPAHHVPSVRVRRLNDTLPVRTGRRPPVRPLRVAARWRGPWRGRARSGEGHQHRYSARMPVTSVPSRWHATAPSGGGMARNHCSIGSFSPQRRSTPRVARQPGRACAKAAGTPSQPSPSNTPPDPQRQQFTLHGSEECDRHPGTSRRSPTS